MATNPPPNFKPTAPHIDPQAIVNVLQRKAAMEQEQINVEQTRRQEQFKGIMDAVVQGQTIASNMMTLAEKRNQTKGLADLNNIINTPEPAAPAPTASSRSLGTFGVQPSPEQEQEHQDQLAQRQRDFTSALVRANPDAATSAMLKQKFENPNKLTMAMRKTPVNLELPNGEQTLGIFDPTQPQGEEYRLQDGSPAPVGTKRSYKYDLREDASGDMRVLSGASGKQVGEIGMSSQETPESQVGKVNSIWSLPPKEKLAAEKAIDEYTKEPSVRGARSAFLSTEVVTKGLAARNFVFDEKLGLSLARTFGDAGNISIVEQEVGRESRQLVERGKQLLERYVKTGELTEENRTEVLRALKTLKYAQLQRLDQEADLVVDRVTGPDGEIPKLNREKFKLKLVGPSMQKAMDNARKQLDTLPDLETDIDITDGSAPGKKGTTVNRSKKPKSDPLGLF